MLAYAFVGAAEFPARYIVTPVAGCTLIVVGDAAFKTIKIDVPIGQDTVPLLGNTNATFDDVVL